MAHSWSIRRPTPRPECGYRGRTSSWTVVLAVLLLLALDGCRRSRAGATPRVSDVVAVTTLSPDAGHWKQSATSMARVDLLALVQARGEGAATARAQRAGCDMSALLIFDDVDERRASHLLCVRGLGSLEIDSVTLSGMHTWGEGAATVWPGENPALLWPRCAAIACPAMPVAPRAEVRVAGNEPRHKLSIYRLKPVPDTWDRVSQFAVSDASLSEAQIRHVASTRDFIWAGDVHPDAWNAANPSMLVGHYQTMNGIGNGEFAHCTRDADCSLPGYKCQSMKEEPGNRRTLFFAGDRICASTPKELERCDTDADCAVPGTSDVGTCSDNHCRLSPVLMQRAEYAWWRAEHPTWILYRKSPAVEENVAWWGHAPQMPLDLTNPAVLDEVLRHVDRFLSSSSAYSVVSLDVVNLVNYQGATGISRDGVTVTPLFSGEQMYDRLRCAYAHGYCDFRWTQAVLAWLHRFGDEMHARSQRLVVNLQYSGSAPPIEFIPPDNPELNEMFQVVDGVFDEAGFTFGHARQSPGTCTAWRYDGEHTYDAANPYFCLGRSDMTALTMWSDYAFGYMASVQGLQKPYYTKNAFPPASGSDTVTQDEEEWALASYLMAKQHHASLYVTRDLPSGDDCATPDYAQTLATAIGHPCGPPLITPGGHILSRQFQHGLVLVNPSALTPEPDVFLLGSRRYYSWGGAKYNVPVGGSVAIPFQSGRVLWSPDQACP